MKKIKSFSLAFFTNHALVSFCAEIESHVKASLPVENATLCDVFSASLSAFKDILTSSVETFNEAILEADKKADGAWSAINTLLNLNVNHYDAAICEAARSVLNVLITSRTQLVSEWTPLTNCARPKPKLALKLRLGRPRKHAKRLPMPIET